jgi:hypothetical protein
MITFIVSTEHLLEHTPGAATMKSPSHRDSRRQARVLSKKFR